MTAAAQAAAVQAAASITDRTGTLLTFSTTNEYDIVATTRQQENTQFATVLPSLSLSDANGFSFAGCRQQLRPVSGDFGRGA